VVKAFNSINEATGNNRILFLLGAIFPFVANLPTKRFRMMDQMKMATSAIAYELLQNTEKVEEGSQSIKDRSILGLLSQFYSVVHVSACY
jgi:hypothetical protein